MKHIIEKQNINRLFLMVLFGLVLFSCNKEAIEQIEPVNRQVRLILSKDLKQVKNSENYIASELGILENFIAPTDYIAGVSSLKANPLQEESISKISQSMMTKEVQLSSFKAASITLNGISLENSPTKSSINNDSDIYGSNASFIIRPESSRRSSSSIDTTVEMYIPELIKITSPVVNTSKDLYPLCYYKNFTVKWNADRNNDYGVMVVIEWLGSLAFGKNANDIFVRNSDLLDVDNGEAVLDERLFENIPDTALVYLTIYRGNCENVLVENISYKLIGETHAVLPFILIRNIKNK